jgi:hypothetical protein
MKRMILISVMVLALVLVYAATEPMACGMKDKGKISKLLGTIVKGPQGEDIAVIADFMKDSVSRAAFFILTYGAEDEYGQGARTVAVPSNILSCGEENCVLNIARERLDSAPVFTSKEDFAEQRMAEDVYRYFGLQPFWTD